MDIASERLLKTSLRSALIICAIAVIIAGGITVFVKASHLSFYTISGNSMAPTLKDKETLLLQRTPLLRDSEIVLFNKPADWKYKTGLKPTSELLIKRVVAVSGDLLSYDETGLYVNNKLVYNFVANNYPCTPKVLKYKHRLKNHELFVMGDNAHASFDSRYVFCSGQTSFFVPLDSLEAHGTIYASFKTW